MQYFVFFYSNFICKEFTVRVNLTESFDMDHDYEPNVFDSNFDLHNAHRLENFVPYEMVSFDDSQTLLLSPIQTIVHLEGNCYFVCNTRLSVTNSYQIGACEGHQ